MPIDPRMVKWDDSAPDPSQVQWDGEPKPKQKPKGNAHANDVTGTVMGALDGLQHHIVNAPLGLAQLAGHGVASAVEGFAPGYAARLLAQDKGLQQREQDYQARTDGNAGSYLGATVGEVAPWMVGIGEARALGLLPKAANLAQKVGLISAEGGAMGLLSPVTQDGSYADHKARQVAIGAVAAPLLHAGTTGALGAVRGVSKAANYLTDAGRERIAQARLAQIPGLDPAQLRSAPQYVPGEQPSIEQASPDPRVLQAARVLRNDPNAGPQFVAQDNANNQARMSVVQGLAGTDADMAAAKAARFNATDPYYQQLAGKGADPTSVLQALDILHNSSLGVRPNIRNAAASLKAEITSRTGPDGMIPADILSGLHENAGSHLGPMASAQEKRALGPIKDSIANALDAAVPGYRANLAAYASHSQPIGDMQAARALRDAIDRGGRDASGNPIVNLSQVKSALGKNDRARFPMSPQAESALEGVLRSRQRAGISDNKVAASGPGTAAEVKSGLLSSDFGKHLMRTGGSALGLLAGHLTGVPYVGDAGGLMLGGLLGEGVNKANGDVMRKVGEKAANAQKAADALEAYRLQQARKRQGLLAQLPDYLLPYAAP